MPQNLLEQLRKHSVIVVDTGDIESMERFKPRDATTNPSHITNAAKMPKYQPILDGELISARKELGAERERPGGCQPGLPPAGHCVGQKYSRRCSRPRVDRGGCALILRH